MAKLTVQQVQESFQIVKLSMINLGLEICSLDYALSMIKNQYKLSEVSTNNDDKSQMTLLTLSEIKESFKLVKIIMRDLNLDTSRLDYTIQEIIDERLYTDVPKKYTLSVEIKD